MEQPPQDGRDDFGFGPLPPSPERSEAAPAPAFPPAPPPPLPGAPGSSPAGGPFRVEKGRPVSLHAMGLGETLDAAFRLYKSSWKLFVGASALLLIPLNFIQSFLTRENLGVLLHPDRRPLPEPNATSAFATFGFVLITFLIVNPFLTALFARATSQIYLGKTPELSETLRFARSKIPSILLITILTFLAVVGGTVLLIIPGIIFYVRFTFGTAAMVVEDVRGRKAMKRSWRLAKGRFWPLLGTLFIASIITSFVSGAIGLPLSLAAQVIGPGAWPLAALGNSLASIIARPLVVIVVVVLYFDLRIRKEGFDITLMIDALADQTPGA